LAQYAAVLRNRDTWIFMGMYSVTFGGFSALASFLPVYFHDVYSMDPVKAGLYTSACVFAGSMVRPLGGAIADKAGGVRTLTLAFLLAGSFLSLVAFGLQSAGMALAAFIASMLFLGAGNGAIFQLVPQAFPKSVGVMTGLVGMAGGVGGFALTSFMGVSKQLTGEYVAGLSAFTFLAILSLGVLSVFKTQWRSSWGAAAVGARI
jgi:NNP family nitrate/nitrite transporter-like MFS transporter